MSEEKLEERLTTKEDVILARVEEKLDHAFEHRLIDKTDGCKEACCELGPDTAYKYCILIDTSPDDKVRNVVSEDNVNAFSYAVHIDKGKPNDVTRTGASKNPYTAYLYARHIDDKITEQTEISAKRVPSVYQIYIKYFSEKK